MKNKTCGECEYHTNMRCHLPQKTFIIVPETEACRHFTQKPKMTNGDKIRQMLDEELAFMLVPKVMFCDGCPVKCEEKDIPTLKECPFGTDNIKNICVQRVIAWLKQETKDE